ncbi:MAG TPA: glycoside hydrolase family 31 protein [Myxococcota bacterium]|nr:glycoside hydrolase family 31 protein [Myxococcota bacterium]
MLLLFLACKPASTGAWSLLYGDDGSFDLLHERHGPVLEDVHLASGLGEVDVLFAVGSYRFTEQTEDLVAAGRIRKVREIAGGLHLELQDADKEPLGTLVVTAAGDTAVLFTWVADVDANRAELSFACGDEPLMGLGSHAFDVEHSGEDFALWTSEPGIGKSDSDEYPADWYLTGTRHATSFPMPWVLRPDHNSGVLADTTARVEARLCTDGRIALRSWEADSRWVVFASDDTLDTIRALGLASGPYELPEPWVFAPWNDAIRGEERVREVLSSIRQSGAASTVIWTEDWKGAEEGPTGYHLKGEWFLDREFYPNAEDVAQELRDSGIYWFAYFSPFLYEDTQTYEDAAGLTIETEDGEPYLFTGPTFGEMTMIDLTLPEAREFALEHMEDAIEVGFRGWMADYAEWLPTDAVLAGGDAWIEHNRWPLAWQALNREAFDGVDGSFFVRSGWTGTTGLAPVVWLGDQRTSFDTDDGFPTIVPLALGLSAGGVPVVTHDVAGYQSIGNEPTTEELWYRWTALGAFSPIMRTHHGAFEDENFQFDHDEDSLAFWAEMTHEHMRIWPYRYGLAAKAATDGTPMLLHPAWVYEGEDHARIDAWLMGEGMLVRPVVEEGAASVQVDLPAGRWWDWWTMEEANSGPYEVPLDTIPVFVAEGSIVPTFDVIPETLLDGTDLVDFDDADVSRTIYVFGDGGHFVEADGTIYAADGAATGTATETLKSGTISVGGLELMVSGSVERVYTVVAVD